MPRPDRLTWDAQFGDWAFTLAVGLAVGLIAAGLYRLRRGDRAGAAWWCGSGLAFGLFCLVAVLDAAGPLNWVHLQFKPLVSRVLEALVLGTGLVLGAASAFALAIAVRRQVAGGWMRVAQPVLPVVLVAAGVVASLWTVDWYNTRNLELRHPRGTILGQTVEAVRVIEGLDVPTGLAFAPNGDLATVELVTANVRLFRPNGDGFEEVFRLRLPVAEGSQGFHVTFHPDYPAQPYAYATAENDTAAGRVMQVIRVDLSRADGAPVVAVDGLPVAPREIEGVHYGSGMAFCGGSLFVGTADAEPGPLHTRPLSDPEVIRKQAQSVDSGAGKILRWDLEGIDLRPAGLAGTKFPVYAIGFRNPFAVTCDEETGFPFVADNGAGRGHDQLRLVTPGANAEWPLSHERDTLAEPLFDTGLDVRTAPDGVVVRANKTGREAVWSAFQSQAVYSISFDSSGRATSKLRLLREVPGGPFGIAADSHGCVYFSDGASVWRLDDGRCAR